MADFVWRVAVETDDAYIDMGDFKSSTPIDDDDIRLLLRIAFEGKGWDYTLERVYAIALICIDTEYKEAHIYDIDPADVWPAEFDSKTRKYYERLKEVKNKRNG